MLPFSCTVEEMRAGLTVIKATWLSWPIAAEDWVGLVQLGRMGPRQTGRTELLAEPQRAQGKLEAVTFFLC